MFVLFLPKIKQTLCSPPIAPLKGEGDKRKRKTRQRQDKQIQTKENKNRNYFALV